MPEVFVTAEQVKHGKPAPDAYLLGAERLGLAMLHLLSGDKHLRHRQARRAVTRMGNRNRAGGDKRISRPNSVISSRWKPLISKASSLYRGR
jgi:FMN phosphatase YigB (HAD superfamily)